MENKKVQKKFTITIAMEIYNGAYGTLDLENIIAIFNEVNYAGMKATITEIREEEIR